MPADCFDHGPIKLGNVEEGRVYFIDQPGMTESFRLRDNDYIFVKEEIDGSVWETHGKCQRARFSGWKWHVRKGGGVAPD
jgi:hypothetical protein